MGSGGKDRGKAVLCPGPTWEAVTKPSPQRAWSRAQAFLFTVLFFVLVLNFQVILMCSKS